jgi:hypothetical protein
VTALLRAAYAAPSDDNYWQSFEKRVMARINESAPVAWWAVFSEWRQAGVIAATIALLLAGATMVREQQFAENARQLAAGAAYYTIFEDANGDVSVAFTVPLSDSTPVGAPERYLDAIYP